MFGGRCSAFLSQNAMFTHLTRIYPKSAHTIEHCTIVSAVLYRNNLVTRKATHQALQLGKLKNHSVTCFHKVCEVRLQEVSTSTRTKTSMMTSCIEVEGQRMRLYRGNDIARDTGKFSGVFLGGIGQEDKARPRRQRLQIQIRSSELSVK